MRHIKLAAMVAALTLVIAACGADSAETTTTQAPATTTTTEVPAPTTVVDIAANNEGFSTLVAALQAAGLVETLQGDGPFTVFAPTDEAFAAALDGLGLTAEELLADTETLTSILTYHVLAIEADSSVVATLDGEMVETVNGESITVSIDGDSVMVNEAKVTAVDLRADNGVVHVIDAVLLPPSMTETAMDDEPGTIPEVVIESGEFPTLLAAVQAAGLADVLSGEGPFTVFAPTEEAFAAALDALGITAEELLADTETLTAILTYHVLPVAAPAELVVTLDGQEVETVNGASVEVSINDGGVMVNDANVIQTDILASNGVIHVIDKVILPPSN